MYFAGSSNVPKMCSSYNFGHFYFIFQVCLWGEFVNSMNAIPRLWPRASATAEVLWSQKTDELNSAASRLQEHECRMMARGKPVQPVVGAGFCPGHWDF